MKTGLLVSRVLLILRRELIDQLRDRRTLFAVLVLPMLLYPLLGIALLQMAVLFTEQPRFFALVGAENLPSDPPLLAEGRLHPEAVPYPDYARLLIPSPMSLAEAEGALRGGKVSAILIVHDPVAQVVRDGKQAVVEIRYQSSDEASELVAERLQDVLEHWQQQLALRLVEEGGLSPAVARPLQVQLDDLAAGTPASRARLWGRLVPFLIVLMIATGTFYPAVDLIAGEKERGTLETILVSAASRLEIVLGKLCAVTLFGIVAGVAHLASVAFTTGVVVRRFAAGTAEAEAVGLSPPGTAALLLTFLATIPVAVALGGISTLLAALSRSVKEAQYYLTPYFAVLLLLVAATLSPGIELSWRTALLPFTGHTLLLRSLLQGEFRDAVAGLPALALTLTLTVGAIALAVKAFYSEAILNREAEQGPLWQAVVQYRQEHAVPGIGLTLVVYCAMVTAQWFVGALLPGDILSVIPVQVLGVFLPPVAAAVIATGQPGRTLLIRQPRARELLAVVLVFVGLHPVAFELARMQERAWGELPPAFQELEALVRSDQVSLPLLLFALAVVPAICEEVAFRGWLLSGLHSRLPAGGAVLGSALLFAFFHGNPLQFPTAFALGLLLGAIALRARSIWPCILGHMLHNGLVLLAARQLAGAGGQRLPWLYDGGGGYHPWVVAAGMVIAACGVWLLWQRLPAAGDTRERV